eukprot:8454948-Pyramimonas_sp.AAC.1
MRTHERRLLPEVGNTPVLSLRTRRRLRRSTMTASRQSIRVGSVVGRCPPSPHPIGPRRQNAPPLLARLVHIDRICTAGEHRFAGEKRSDADQHLRGLFNCDPRPLRQRPLHASVAAGHRPVSATALLSSECALLQGGLEGVWRGSRGGLEAGLHLGSAYGSHEA